MMKKNGDEFSQLNSFSNTNNKHVLMLSWKWNERTDKSEDDDDEKQFK